MQTAGLRRGPAYCAEVLALTFEAPGLLPGKHRPDWYNAGRFWSGDDLGLSAGFALGGEIAVQVPQAMRPSQESV